MIILDNCDRKNSKDESEIAVRQGVTQLILSDKNISKNRICNSNAISCWCSKYLSY